MPTTPVNSAGNAVAVVGLSCRFPGARNHHEFAANLNAGTSSIGQIEADRWDLSRFYSPDVTAPGRSVSKWCGMVEEPYGFDHLFFRISRREARSMDPQQRLLLQESWNCVEDSGIDLGHLRRARTSVHMGVMGRDHLQAATDPGVPVESHSGLGGYDCLLANRVSHVLGLRGASVSVDAACASSLVSVHMAARSLTQGETDFALAGGVSLNLHPWKYISFSKARMLSPRGLCRTFDKSADGYVPGDGVAVLLLRRLEDAERDGDHVYGVIRGGAVNHGGNRPTITAPTVDSQVDVVTAALEGSGTDPRTVGYVEAHGTGTSLGDPVEVEALRRVFTEASQDTGWCRIGSVKPNIGHLEAAAGAAGLIKVLMMMRDRVVPPSVHISEPNPLIDFEDGPFRLALAPEDWTSEEPDEPLRAGVSSFGMGGVNAHMVVEEHLPSSGRSAEPHGEGEDPGAHPFLLSAHSAASLRRSVDEWKRFLAAGGASTVSVPDVCATLATGRTHSGHRLAGVVHDLDDIAQIIGDGVPSEPPAQHEDWWLRVGQVSLPSAPVVREFIDSPGPRGVLDTTAEATDGLAGTVERLRAGEQGPGEQCLFGYLLLRFLLDHGLEPAAVCAPGPGLWPALAAVGSLDPADAVRIAEGVAAGGEELFAPTVPLVDPATGEPWNAPVPDGQHLRSLLVDTAPNGDEHARLVAKGASLVEGQHTFRNNLREWNSSLHAHGRSDREVPIEAAGLQDASEPEGERSLFTALAVQNALDRLNRKWDLPRERVFTDPHLGEVLDLLLEGLLTAEDVLELLEDGDADAVAERMAGRFRLLPREALRTSPTARRWASDGMGTVAQWRSRAENGSFTDPPPGTAVLSIGECTGTADTGAAHVEIGGEESLTGLLVRPLTELWLAGARLDWGVRYPGGTFRKTPLPTRVFDPHHHRLDGPAEPVAAHGSAESEAAGTGEDEVMGVESYWRQATEDPPQATPESAVLVVVADGAGAQEQERASRAFSPRPVYWAREGDSFTETAEGWLVRPREREDWSRVVGSERLSSGTETTVVVLGTREWKDEDTSDSVTEAALVLFPLLQALSAERERFGLVHAGRAVDGAPGPVSSAVAGLSASLRRETAAARLVALAMDGPPQGEEFWTALADETARDGHGAVLRVGGRRFLRRHRVMETGAVRPLPERPAPGSGTYLVAGGGGGLGVLTARHLLRDPGNKVVLLGRSPNAPADAADLITECGTRATYLSADITDPDALSAAVEHARSAYGPITGVVHAAGVLRDGSLPTKTEQDVRAVLAPKVTGTVNLDEATRDDPIEVFVLFSSAVAVVGNPGQTDYGFANSFLDGFAGRRRSVTERSGRTVVIHWPLWAEGGMSVGEESTGVFGPTTGLTPLPTGIGLALFDDALVSANDNHTFLHGGNVEAPALLEPRAFAPPSVDTEQPVDGDAALDAARSYCASVLSDLLSVPEEEIDHDLGLDQYGLDSILITQFSTRLENDLGVVAHTLLFECRTLDQAASRIAAQAPAALLARKGTQGPEAATQHHGALPPPVPTTVPVPEREEDADDGAVAIIGLDGRYPGTDDLDGFWDGLLHGRDAVTEIPSERWDHRLHYAPEAADEGGMYCKWGAFLRDVDCFDPFFFGISPREAEMMDPQERLFLQSAWRTFEDAGYPPYRLGEADSAGGRSVGVFVGVTTQSYLLWGPDHRRRGGRAVPNSMPWSIANRVSYWMDLHGPSMPVDTACASSLSALHLAYESLSRGECGMALVGGVNLYLHPSKYEWLCQMQMLSRSGRCHTFGSEADGFVPGEGVGAVLLKPLRRARADNDRILGVVRGTAVNHGGRTNGFTVPDPRAQAELVDTALRRAGLGPDDIDYVEAHGTGTALGDPVEIAGLRQVFDGAGPSEVAIGSVKTNIGHLESAAGIAGLTKVLLQMRHRTLVPSLNAEHDNPRIDFAETPFRLQRQAAVWHQKPTGEAPGEYSPRRAGISAFGAGGSNAHVVVEEYTGALPPRGSAGGLHLAVVSARDEERLRAWCGVLAGALRAMDELPPLSEVAHQLQVRREPLQRRVAYLVHDVDELIERLRDEEQGEYRHEDRWAGGGRPVNTARAEVERALAEGDLPALAAHWVAGARVPWARMYPEPLRHVELPGYPFARERHWLPRPPEGARGLSWPQGGGPGAEHPFVDVFEDGEGSVLFNGEEFFLDDHRVDGVPVFPAVGYLEMVGAAARSLGARVRSLKSNVWDAPVTVEEPRRVHIALTERTGGYSYEVFSHSSDGERLVHGRGRAETGTPAPGAEPEPVDVDAVRARCSEQIEAREFYPRVHERGLQLGPGYQGARRFHFGRDEVLSELRLPEHLETGSETFALHPSVLDSALQGSLELIARRGPGSGLHLPFTIGSVEVFGPLPRRCSAHVVLRTATENGGKFEVRVLDEAGTVLVLVRDFWLRPWKAQLPAPEKAQTPGSFFHPVWEDTPLSTASAPGQDAERAVTVLLAPSLEAGRMLLRARAGTGTAVVAVPGEAYRERGNGEFEVRPHEAEDLTRLVSALPTAARRDVVVLWSRTVFSGTVHEFEGQFADGLVPLLHLTRAVLSAGDRTPTRFLYVFPGERGNLQPAYEALGGMLRTAGRESRRLSHRLLELPVSGITALAAGDPSGSLAPIEAELDAGWEEGQHVRYERGRRLARIWKNGLSQEAAAPSPLRRGGVHVITGGAGGLGALTALHLASTVSARMVLVGRSEAGTGTQALLRRIREAGGEAIYLSADVSGAEGAEHAVRTARETYGAVNGVFHCAGVLRDGYLMHESAPRVEEVASPKMRGALHLDSATRDDPLDLFVLSSSIASALGNPGQAGYSYANAFLDAFAEWRNERQERGTRSGTTLSVNWPLWAEGGMGVDEQVRVYLADRLGIAPLETAPGLAAMDQLLTRSAGQVLFVPGHGAGVAALLKADVSEPEREVPVPAPVEVVPVPPAGEAGGDGSALRALLSEEVADTVGFDPARVEPDADIGDYGFDSISFGKLANKVNQRLGTDLTPAAFFEYTSVDAVALHLEESFPDEVAALRAPRREVTDTDAESEERSAGPQKTGGTAAPSPQTASPRVPSAAPVAEREPIAVVGMHGVLPGSGDLDEYWQHLDNGRDLVTEIPADRWDWREYFGDPLDEPGTTNSKWGGFLRDVDRFDARFFGISPREAELMDPQQRLFLETSYKAIEEAGYKPSDLARERTGLFVGVATHDYYELLNEAGVPVEAYTTTGMFHAILANRVSYLLNLKGPSFPIDTACSSSLVAIRSAVESIWSGGCDTAIAGGVNLLLAPMIYISFARAGMLSPDGRCKAFDESANGYVRGEGAGALLLKPLSRAIRDGDHVHAVIRGSAVNHGGRVNTLTTPNPNAQSDLIVRAFEEGGVDPETVGYMEVHGTGTALGDPIEINGLNRAFRELRDRSGLPRLTEPTTLVGSVKSNIGHLEAAAGMAGIFKVILSMKHGRVPGNLHIENVNPQIKLEGGPLRLAESTQPWPRPRTEGKGESPRRAGVSSFGFGGVNGHVLLEEYVEPGPGAVADPIGPQLVVLSARTPERLAEYAGTMARAARSAAVPGNEQGDVKEAVAAEIAALLGVRSTDIHADDTLEELGLVSGRLTDLRVRLVEIFEPVAAFDGPTPEHTVADLAAEVCGDATRGDAPEGGGGRWLRDAAHTLQTGREAMEHRLAVVAESPSALAEQLSRFAETTEPAPGVYTGTAGPEPGREPPSGEDPHELARHWVSGGSVDWDALHRGERPRRISLPTYPFARTRHWIPGGGVPWSRRAGALEAPPHAALQREEPEKKEEETVPVWIDSGTALVDQHRIRGRAVLPGVAHLELARGVLAKFLAEPVELQRVSWSVPFEVSVPGRELSVEVAADGLGARFEISTSDGDTRTVHVRGNARAVLDTSEADPLPAEETLSRCPASVDHETVYRCFSRLGIDYGPNFRTLGEVRIGEGEAIAPILAAEPDTGDEYALYAPVMDAALQLVTAMEFEHGDVPATTRLPFSVESVRILRPLRTARYARVEALPGGGHDAVLMDDRGRVCAWLGEVTVREVKDPSAGLLFAPYWRERPLSGPPAEPDTDDHLVVHLGASSELSGKIARNRGEHRVWNLYLTDRDGKVAERAWEADSRSSAGMAHALGGMGRIRHVWVLGDVPPRGPGSALTGATERSAQVLFRFVKALADSDLIQVLKTLRIAVSGVQDVDGNRVDDPLAAGLIGFSKSFAKEFPHIDTVCVDLGVGSGTDLSPVTASALVDSLSREPAHRRGEEVAYASGKRYEKALAPIGIPARPTGPPFRKHGRYLLVGGTGGIGSTLARHLARTVSARMVLVGRRPHDTGIDDEIAAIEASGGRAFYLRADVSDPEGSASALAEARTLLGGIDGVVHTAMVLRDGIIERLDETGFDEVMAPKAAGSMALAGLLVNEPLDFVLFMSSVQSFTGSAGQSNYAAASMAQDGVARWLAPRADYPVRSVNWGLWGTVGHVASPEYQQRLASQGHGSIGPAEGMEVVERVLSGDEQQVVAVRADERVLSAIGADLSGEGAVTVPGAPFTPLSADVNTEQRALDSFVRVNAVDVLRSLGLFRDGIRGHLRTELVRDTGALPKYGPLLETLCGILAGHGHLLEEEGRFFLPKASPAGPVTSADHLVEDYPNLSARVALATTCLAAMPRVLRGEATAAEVLFPSGDTGPVSGIYRDEELVDHCNALLADRVRARVLQRIRDPRRTAGVRVLEIGAGTGATTRSVLAALEGLRGVSYDFTDVSERFLRQAERELPRHGAELGFRSLDIDLPLAEQGIRPGHYDVVVAANSVHASKDLDAALGRVRSLLAEDGELVLTEVTRVLAFHTVTFGLLDGWWHHADGDRRLPGSPLLDVHTWRRRLERAGFRRAVALGTSTFPGEPSQRVIAAGTGTPGSVRKDPTGDDHGVPVREEEVSPVKTTGPVSAGLGPQVSGIIRGLVADCLGMSPEEIDGGAPFTSVGVDSIVGVELINRINHELGIVLKTIVIFDHPTVDALTAFVVEEHGTALAGRLTPETTGAEPADGSGEDTAHGPPAAATGHTSGAREEVSGSETAATASTPAAPSGSTGFRAVRFERPGHPKDLRIHALEPVAPGPGEVEIQVRAFPVNFSDFLAARGLYPMMPDFPFTPGVEVSGIVRRTGPDVRRLEPGDEVIALTRPEMGGQASVVITDESFAVRKPSNVTHEEACGFPVGFLAMYLALERAGIREGEHVLVEAATGTNGLMAVQLAGIAGAEVIATAGSAAKVDFLAGLGLTDPIDHSRSDVAEQVMRRTGGRGVDVVVNTRADGALQRGIDLLAPEGRYVEIAVFGLQASGGVDLSRMVDNQSFHSFNTKKFFLRHPEQRVPYLRIMADHLETGRIRPTVAHVVPFDRVADAYALKEDRATVGRVVVTVPEPEVRDGSSSDRTATAPRPGGPESGHRRAPGDIAVVGMSGRFPGAPDLGTLWTNLENGVSSVRPVPPERWDSARYFDPDPARRDTTYCDRGGFLENIDLFDAPFFDVSGKEAEQTDPQQRLFLQESWRALEDAGHPSGSLGGTSCGVFVGVGPSEYLTRMNKAGTTKEAQAFWGNEASVLAARISYFLDLKGPSMAVNTACSSSLVALHLAVQSLRSGECDMALAGGVFLTLAPDYFVVASNGNMLSPDGVCKTFDDSADGFGPGEGVGVLVLKPLERALADGDHVHGVIKGTAINQDGRTNGITAPSGRAQTDVETAAYAAARIDPDTIGYVEAHGTGTRLGDPIEVEALTNAFRRSTDRNGFCAIGSVKTNIGHAAAAAGIAGVVKTLLALRHRRIPASLNFERANRHIDFESTPFYVNTEPKEWSTDGSSPRRAAVSGFGFSGTNAHVVLEEAPPVERHVPDCGPVAVLPVSAQTPTALRARLEDLSAWLGTADPRASLAEIAHELQHGRDHFRERTVFLATTREEFAERLREALTGTDLRPEGAPDGGAPSSLPFLRAQAYLRGEEVDWAALWTGPRGTRLPLPTYPFDGHRYWYTGEDTVYGGGETVGTLAPQPLPSPEGKHRSAVTLTGEESFLRDHVVLGQRTLPGVLVLELLRRAADRSGVRADAVRNLVWESPVAFDTGTLTLVVTLSWASSGTEFEISSTDGAGEPVRHATGKLAVLETGARTETVDLDALSRRCTGHVDTVEHYRRLRERGLVHGPSLTSLTEVRAGETEACARIELPTAADGSFPDAALHPALLDGALQVLAALEDPADPPVLPFAVGEAAWPRTLPARCRVHVVGRRGTADRALKHYDVRITDDQGRVLVFLTDLSTRRLETNPVPQAIGTDEALRALLRRLEAGEIGETEARESMEAILAQR
ncbi:SDR family NAD(P)-dependent oxidoreductase [Nocardiopsis kunsanensis]|uniref:SDR family NAD(P)-dependent oxidoreductase n=1 Tax=Nocardiopsis kunsanensis TaxID=141693 RepID=UPI00034B6F82|nr:SDR family NAD(P)-dependent oxidoreductase [Nocardiopsis kunsanensis]